MFELILVPRDGNFQSEDVFNLAVTPPPSRHCERDWPGGVGTAAALWNITREGSIQQAKSIYKVELSAQLL